MLYDFCSPDLAPHCETGTSPQDGLITSARGQIYGSTSSTLFGISQPNSELTPILQFRDGPEITTISDIAVAADGTIYGVSRTSGADCEGSGCGMIFSFDPKTHSVSILHAFTGGKGGREPVKIVLVSSETLLGITSEGGLDCPTFGCGTVFSFSLKTHKFSTVYRFSGASDGKSPNSITLAADGNLYGTTSIGGLPRCAANRNYGCGTIFQFSYKQKKLRTLHTFQHKSGEYPLLVVAGKHNDLFGVTQAGGDAEGGTVFHFFVSQKRLVTVKMFSLARLGSSPCTGLSIAQNGDVYGALSTGGAKHWGSIFELDDGLGKFVTIHSFDQKHGSFPSGSFAFSKGALYGTTQSGGPFNRGTIFRLSLK